MKKNGFTLIELIVCFAIVTILSVSIFKAVLSMQKNQIKNLSYNSYLSFASVLNNTIQKDFNTDTISNVVSCGINCYYITYKSKGDVILSVDKENNTITYDNKKEKIPNGYKIYKNISFISFSAMSSSIYDSYYLLKIPIKADLFPNMEDLLYMHLYNSTESASEKYVLHIDLDGGSAEGLSENGLYLQDAIINLPTPQKDGYSFAGWQKILGSGTLSGNVFTMGSGNANLKALWETEFLGYSKLVFDYKCSNVSAGETPYIIEYAGACELINDGNENWRMKLLGDASTHSGTHNLISTTTTYIDVFLVGGGGGGGGSNGSMGGGGGGGYTTMTTFNLEPSTYSIVIGTGGNASSSGGSTSAFGFTAAGGAGGSTDGSGGNGGSGGGSPGNTIATSTGGAYGSNGNSGGDYGAGTGQDITTCEFEQSISGSRKDLTGCAAGITPYAGGGCGSKGFFSCIASVGGGGAYNVAGAANTGGGGGAYSTGAGAKGGSGIVIIRNHKS